MFCFVLAESDTIINNFRDSMLYFVFLFLEEKKLKSAIKINTKVVFKTNGFLMRFTKNG